MSIISSPGSVYGVERDLEYAEQRTRSDGPRYKSIFICYELWDQEDVISQSQSILTTDVGSVSKVML